MNMLSAAERNELDDLLKEKGALVLKKKSHELELTKLKNAIRGRGRLDQNKYRMCIDGQNRHLQAIHDVESQIVKIAVRQRELAALQNERYANAAKQAEEPPQDPVKSPRPEDNAAVDIVFKIAELRDEYRKVSADRTRVSSMRTNAAEFAQRLDAILEPYKDL